MMDKDKKIAKKKTKSPLMFVQNNNYSEDELAIMAELPITINVMYGSTKMNLYHFTKLNLGGLIELDQFCDEPLELCVNGEIIAKGELEKSTQGWGIRITAIQSKMKRIKCLND